MLIELQSLVWVEKKITADILEKLQEVYDKKDFAGYRNLFEYMVKGLGYSEATASLRQSCLKLMKEIPMLKEKIDEGTLSYTTLARSYKFIKNLPTQEKKATLITLENKSSREALQILEASAEAPVLKIKTRHYKESVRLTLDLSYERYEKLKRTKALRSNKVHNMEELMLTLIDEADLKYQNINFKQTKSKNPRQISQSLRNYLLHKANYKCQHKDCSADHYLHIDHIKPVRLGGTNNAENLQILCHFHNQQKA